MALLPVVPPFQVPVGRVLSEAGQTAKIVYDYLPNGDFDASSLGGIDMSKAHPIGTGTLRYLECLGLPMDSIP